MEARWGESFRWIYGEWWEVNFGALFFTLHVFCLVGREKPGVVLSEEEM